MAYNFYPAGYQPAQIYYPTQPNANPTQMNVAPTQHNAQSNQFQNGTSSLIWVNGEVGAKSYLVAPNTTVVLWDSESQTIYLKSADAAGMPSIKVLDYTMREDTAKSSEIKPVADFATKEDISLIREEIDAIKEDLKPKKPKASER